MSTAATLTPEMQEFQRLIQLYRYDFCRLAYVLFPFGEPGHALEHFKPRTWQMKEWAKMSAHLQNPITRYLPYKLVISTGNGSGKTAFGAITMLMLLYTQKLRGRVTANTKPQLTQIVWPEYDKWFRHARYSDILFEKFGESIKSQDEIFHDQWQFSLFTWDESNPAAVSGLHNQGHAILYTFEEAPGIPAEIFKYANGAFAATNTIKFWLALGNSDDPDSKFESLMEDPGWNALRIDTRTLDDVDKAFVASVLRECGGDEDADDFRIRVRGLPRKTNADAIISRDRVSEALDRGAEFDIAKVNRLPCIITCDPAWTGGDLTTIWVHQGNWSKLLAAYALDKARGDDHKITYDLMVKYEKLYGADAVYIDQGEGTTLKTLANQDGRFHWELVSFAALPNDNPDSKQSEFANMRAQMYYQTAKYLRDDMPVIEISKDILPLKSTETVEQTFIKQMGYTKGDRHKVTLKKLCESKKDLKVRVGESPDLADGFVLRCYRQLLDRLPENETQFDSSGRPMHRSAGDRAFDLPETQPDYNMGSYRGLYR